MIYLYSNLIPTAFIFAILLGGCNENKEDKIIPGDKPLSVSLEKVINQNRSMGFACSFGHFEVEIVPSKYENHKYFKLNGKGVLVNSGWVHTDTHANPDIIYAVPKNSPIEQGKSLAAFCIDNEHVPYEGKEREKYDQKAAVLAFAHLEAPHDIKIIKKE